MKNLLQNSSFELIVRWLLGAIFLIACVHKIAEPAKFAKIIYGYYLFPNVSINLFAITLPYLELFAGIALILGIYPRSAALIINTMLLVFIIAISINLIRGHAFDCGCFFLGDSSHASSALQLLSRDIFCFFIGLPVLLFNHHRKWCLYQSGSILGNLPARMRCAQI